MKRALVTGMTPMQCNSERTQLKIKTAAAAWARALTLVGYKTEHRTVEVGEDLSGYAVVLVGLSQPNAIAAGKLFSGLEALRQRPDAIGFVDDWQTREFFSGMKVYAVGERLWRLPRFGSEAARQTKRSKHEFEAVVQRFAQAPWPIPVIVCAYGNGDLSLLKLPAALTAIDPTNLVEHGAERVPDRQKQRRWIWASLLSDYAQLDAFPRDWPVIAYGSKDRSGPGSGQNRGPAGPRALPRLPEPQLLAEYALSWGIAQPRHATAGSGWWRGRTQIARDVGSILSCAAEEEAALLGESYVLASDPCRVTGLSTTRLKALAAAQADDLAQLSWPIERITASFKKLIRDR